MRRFKAFLLPGMFLIPVITLLGCSAPQGIAVNQRQAVVMDSPVLSAGILAEKPAISTLSGRSIATSTLMSSSTKAVTVNYRFYWYDAQGLDLLPFETPRKVTIGPNSSVDIQSITPNLDARSVRLYLFL
ncbi:MULTISPECIES: YcfL family protein [Yersinia]|uniref:YcfL family protein n=1 Tax=Yersinia TaxID=629 RepID=UPI000EAEE317|nr:DUF1425 domain-containing protein [Yersinia sp. IP36721]